MADQAKTQGEGGGDGERAEFTVINGKRYRITETKLVTTYPPDPKDKKAKRPKPYQYTAAWIVPDNAEKK